MIYPITVYPITDSQSHKCLENDCEYCVHNSSLSRIYCSKLRRQRCEFPLYSESKLF